MCRCAPTTGDEEEEVEEDEADDSEGSDDESDDDVLQEVHAYLQIEQQRRDIIKKTMRRAKNAPLSSNISKAVHRYNKWREELRDAETETKINKEALQQHEYMFNLQCMDAQKQFKESQRCISLEFFNMCRPIREQIMQNVRKERRLKKNVKVGGDRLVQIGQTLN
jgi:hypothetical protein